MRMAEPRAENIKAAEITDGAGKRSANMTTAKERMAEIVEQQPDDSSYEEILRELAFACMIERGIEDSRAGRTISNEEMERRIRSWQE
jgi:predicted transcriptional regulator